ncbi:MAG: hypothetical protein JO222_07695 [Frankiales bacterium]|nr:hypothetical protein [Frankiales bacterium]
MAQGLGDEVLDEGDGRGLGRGDVVRRGPRAVVGEAVGETVAAGVAAT